MHSIEVVLAMLLAVVASGYLVRILPVSLPLPLVQIGLGAVVAGVFGWGHTLDPQLFFLLFLPPLLFLDGWRIPKQGLFRDKATVIELALGLVLFTVVGAGLLIHWLDSLSDDYPAAVSAQGKGAGHPVLHCHCGCDSDRADMSAGSALKLHLPHHPAAGHLH